MNAGVGGTGSDLGACRLDRHVLDFDPDLVFVEFAVNGAYEPGVEGIIRKIIKDNPYVDICLIYTIFRGQSESYGEGSVPSNVARLDKIAEYYNLPSVHMGMWAGVLQREGKLLWAANKGYKGDEIVFSNDGVHPIKAGGDLYASAVGRAFEAMKGEGMRSKLKLPEPLLKNNTEYVQYVDPSKYIVDAKGWEISDVNDDPALAIYDTWFDKICNGSVDASPIKFRFEGDLFGIYDIGAPDVGAYDIFINGKKLIASRFDHNGKIRGYEYGEVDDPRPSIVRFSKFCYRYTPRYEIVELPYGVYDIEIRVHSNKIDKVALLSTGKTPKVGQEVVRVDENGDLPSGYEEQNVHLGWIMINGKLD